MQTPADTVHIGTQVLQVDTYKHPDIVHIFCCT